MSVAEQKNRQNSGRVVPRRRSHPEAAEVHRVVARMGKLVEIMPLLAGIRDDEQYESGQRFYRALLEEFPDNDESGTERSSVELLEQMLGERLAEYGAKRHPPEPFPGGTPAALLYTLLDQHGLTQSDLPEVGSQGVVSELVNGKRELTARQIKALSARFNVPVDLFLA